MTIAWCCVSIDKIYGCKNEEENPVAINSSDAFKIFHFCKYRCPDSYRIMLSTEEKTKSTITFENVVAISALQASKDKQARKAITLPRVIDPDHLW